jgi:ankyrin repeat protein
VLKLLIEWKCDTAARNKSGQTALHIALFEVEKHSVAKILMTDATALNSVDDDGRTALMTAVIKDDLTSIQRLLEAGADTTLKDKSGHTSLHIALFEVEKHSAAKILMRNKAALNSVDSGGRTALMIAVRKGDLNSMQMLLKAGADTTAIDKHGDTALHIAMYESDCLSCAEVLMAHKAALNSVNDAGRTALMTAVEKEDLTSLQMLLQAGADTALKDKRGFTAIHIALFERKCQSVAEILMADRTALNSVDDDGKSALMIAIEKNDMTILERLLQAGADTTLKDKRGRAAIHIAIEVGRHSALKILIAKKANVDSTVASDNRTALMIAVEKDDFTSVQILLQAGAHPTLTDKAFLAELGWQYDVFLCYTGAEKPFIELLYHEMVSCGLKAFFDKERLMLGQQVQETIAKAIIYSPIFLVVLSQMFSDKGYPEAELKVALSFTKEYTKHIIPVFYNITPDECHVDRRKMYRRLVDFTGFMKKTEPDKQFAQYVAQATKTIAEKELHSRTSLVWQPHGIAWNPRGRGGFEVLYQLKEDVNAGRYK